MLAYLFSDTGFPADKYRHFGDNQTAYWNAPMSSYAAAQFAVSKKAISQRPLSWWRKLHGLSTDMAIFDGCRPEPQRSWISGSMFTQIFERLWHAFFRDIDVPHPLETQPRAADLSLPACLRHD